MTRLSELFMASNGQPIEWNGRAVHGIYELSDMEGVTALRVSFIDRTPAREQALCFAAKDGRLEIDGAVYDQIILWSDSSPQEVTAHVHRTNRRRPPTVKFWNAWRDPLGATQAWIGDAGMLVEPSDDGSLILRCSDGADEPSFDDLVAEVRVGLIG